MQVFGLEVWLFPSLIWVCSIRLIVLAILSQTLYHYLLLLEYLLAHQLVHHRHRLKKLLNKH